MTNEAQLILEIWDYVKDFVPAKRRNEVAASMYKSYENFGFDPSDFKDVMYENDVHLEKAYKELYDIEDEEEDEYNDYED